MPLVGERGQVVRVGDGPDDDRPAVAAVAAVRPALGDVLLPPEARHAAAPVAGLHEDLDTIDEHIHRPSACDCSTNGSQDRQGSPLVFPYHRRHLPLSSHESRTFVLNPTEGPTYSASFSPQLTPGDLLRPSRTTNPSSKGMVAFGSVTFVRSGPMLTAPSVTFAGFVLALAEPEFHQKVEQPDLVPPAAGIATSGICPGRLLSNTG